MNRIAALQKLFQLFPRQYDGFPDFSALEKHLQIYLELDRVLFLIHDKNDLVRPDVGDLFTPRGIKEILTRLRTKKTPFLPEKKQFNAWSEFWPIFVGGDCAGVLALGKKNNGRKLDREGREILELIVDRASLFFENGRLRKVLERAGRQSSLGFMSAAMVHEIRNPLTAMGTLVQLVPRKINDARFMESFQTVMLREINHLEHLTGSFLEFTHSKDKAHERLDLSETVSRMVQFLGPVFSLKKVQLKTKTTRGLFIRGNEHQLKCLIMNLLQNALQAVGPQGVVKITTGISTSRKPGPGSWVELSVEDNGPGVSRENENKLFDPYFTTKEEGLGLGLALCRKIIENHQGFVKAKNIPGKGFQVNVLFPVKKS